MTERNDEIAAFQILWPYSGPLNLELQRELVRGIQNPISTNKCYLWMGCGTWSNLQ